MKVKVEYFKKYLKLLNKVEISDIMGSDELHLDFQNSIAAKSDGHMAINVSLPIYDKALEAITIPATPFINFFLYNNSEEATITVKAKQIILESPGNTIKLSHSKNLVPTAVGRHRLQQLDDIDLVLTKQVINKAATITMPHIEEDIKHVQFSYIYVGNENYITFFSGTDKKLARFISPIECSLLNGGFHLEPKIMDMLKKANEDFEVLLAPLGNMAAFDSGPILITTPLLLDPPVPYSRAIGDINKRNSLTFQTSGLLNCLRSVAGTQKFDKEMEYSIVDVSFYPDRITLKTANETGNAESTLATVTPIPDLVPIHHSCNLRHMHSIVYGWKEDTVDILVNDMSPLLYANTDRTILIANSLIKKIT